jgi:hypothetical protein
MKVIEEEFEAGQHTMERVEASGCGGAQTSEEVKRVG